MKTISIDRVRMVCKAWEEQRRLMTNWKSKARRYFSVNDFIKFYFNPRAKVTSRVVIDVFKSLRNLLPEDLNGYFKLHMHQINTRGNGSYVILLKMHTETGKKSYAYQGARVFNRFEKTTREETTILLFKMKLKLSNSL